LVTELGYIYEIKIRGRRRKALELHECQPGLARKEIRKGGQANTPRREQKELHAEKKP